MKKKTIFLICILLSGVSFTQAQSAGDIDTLSQWVVETHYGHPTHTNYKFKYYISGTEIIDGLEYYKVFKAGVEYYYPYVVIFTFDYYDGGLREENNKWYKYRYTNQDVLLYDFTLSIGDPVAGSNGVTIADIDTIMVNGEPKKRFLLDGAGHPYFGDEYIIEDVGATTGLFEPLVFSVDVYQGHLNCFSIDFVPLWVNPNFPDCNLSVNVDENKKNVHLSTYPNPFTTSTTIDYELTEPSHVQLTIYNAIGETIYEELNCIQPQGTHTFVWTPDRLPEGMYYAVLRSGDGVSVVKMIKQ